MHITLSQPLSYSSVKHILVLTTTILLLHLTFVAVDLFLIIGHVNDMPLNDSEKVDVNTPVLFAAEIANGLSVTAFKDNFSQQHVSVNLIKSDHPPLWFFPELFHNIAVAAIYVLAVFLSEFRFRWHPYFIFVVLFQVSMLLYVSFLLLADFVKLANWLY